jgi:hypothetical protein
MVANPWGWWRACPSIDLADRSQVKVYFAKRLICVDELFLIFTMLLSACALSSGLALQASKGVVVGDREGLLAKIARLLQFPYEYDTTSTAGLQQFLPLN